MKPKYTTTVHYWEDVYVVEAIKAIAHERGITVAETFKIATREFLEKHSPFPRPGSE